MPRPFFGESPVHGSRLERPVQPPIIRAQHTHEFRFDYPTDSSTGDRPSDRPTVVSVVHTSPSLFPLWCCPICRAHRLLLLLPPKWPYSGNFLLFSHEKWCENFRLLVQVYNHAGGLPIADKTNCFFSFFLKCYDIYTLSWKTKTLVLAVWERHRHEGLLGKCYTAAVIHNNNPDLLFVSALEFRQCSIDSMKLKVFPSDFVTWT